MSRFQERLTIVAHTVIIILLYTSPLWLGWKLIAIAIILNYIQIYIFGGCVLTIKQLKSTKISFQEWLLAQLGAKVNRPKFNRFLRWQLPFIILFLAIVWQELLGFAPAINL